MALEAGSDLTISIIIAGVVLLKLKSAEGLLSMRLVIVLMLWWLRKSGPYRDGSDSGICDVTRENVHLQISV